MTSQTSGNNRRSSRSPSVAASEVSATETAQDRTPRRRSARLVVKEAEKNTTDEDISTPPPSESTLGSPFAGRSAVPEDAGTEWKEWKEPPVAEPQPGITGYPLDTLPPAKLYPKLPKGTGTRGRPPKNKSVNRSNRGLRQEKAVETPGSSEKEDTLNRANSSSSLSSLDSTPAAEFVLAVDRLAETVDAEATGTGNGESKKLSLAERLQMALETSKSEEITQPSNVRTPLKRQAKKLAEENILSMRQNMITNAEIDGRQPSRKRKHKGEETGAAGTPGAPGTPGSPEAKMKSGKRKGVKISSPHRTRDNPFGFGPPDDLAKKPRLAAAANTGNSSGAMNGELTKNNDDFCSACGEPGIFLCCDSCPKSFHLACCDPPFDEDTLPEDEWYCRECYARRHPPMPYRKGLFSRLLNQIERRNPVRFSLPKKIKERFRGVHEGEMGEYENNDMKSTKNLTFSNKEDDPVARLYDKDGKMMFCFKCGLSALNDRMITKCDYCDLCWHLDCLNPPLSAAKTIGRKWKCPNHADHDLPKRRLPRKPILVETMLRRGFKNDGFIEIAQENSEDESMYRDYVPSSKLLDNPRIKDGRDSSGKALDTPPVFEAYDTPDGVSAKVCKAGAKAYDFDNVEYVVSERAIKLDFLEFVKKTAMKEGRTFLQQEASTNVYPINTTVLDALEELAERPQLEREAVRNMYWMAAKGEESSRSGGGLNSIETSIEKPEDKFSKAVAYILSVAEGSGDTLNEELTAAGKKRKLNDGNGALVELKEEKSSSSTEGSANDDDTLSESKLGISMNELEMLIRKKGKEAIIAFLKS